MKTRSLSRLIFGISLCALLALSRYAVAQDAPAAPADLVELHDVVIGKGGDRDMHAEIAYPKDAKGPLPAVIMIHGGGWNSGSPREWFDPKLAQAGYFVASVEYRLSEEAKWPAQIEDCKLAVRWLRANAAKYNVDPNRIGVWGMSAGGHLAVCLAATADVKEFEGTGGYPDTSSAVNAVVDYFGPVDFSHAGDFPYYVHGMVEQLIGSKFEDDPEAWKNASPVTYIKKGMTMPPLLIMHGDTDAVVPFFQSRILDQVLKDNDIPHQFIIVKNGDHNFAPKYDAAISPDNDTITKDVYGFFDENLKAPAAK